MEKCDYDATWYHGSPEELTILRKGSWVTQFKELAKAFSHRPPLIKFVDDADNVRHNGRFPGFLYAVAERVGPKDVTYLPDTAQTHWQTNRDLRVELVAKLPPDDPPQLSAEEIAELRKTIPEGTSAFVGEKDKD
jgi:hypothetical protein